jgi:hypothetical protein
MNQTSVKLGAVILVVGKPLAPRAATSTVPPSSLMKSCTQSSRQRSYGLRGAILPQDQPGGSAVIRTAGGGASGLT